MKQTYVEIVKDMFKSYEPEVRQALNGQINPYCYEKERTEEWGDGDKNYNNRLRLSYELCYCEGFDWRTQDFSQLVRRLFSEELKDRETNSFQGIGDALENLTFLLGRYGEKEDEPLFQRAKNANFDCACGYDRALEVPGAVEEYACLYEKSIAFGEQKKDEEFTEKMQREYDKLLGQLGRISRREEEKTEKETGE